ncbi:hypothetical protein BGW41_004046 [Actinomortierella wolfii]|nr:hypothetical protein BGW41_004046 [Actinomortierella wolfii]
MASGLEITAVNDHPALGDVVSEVFAALTSQPAPSSFLIEFDRPPAGISRYQRNELEEEEVLGATTIKRAQASEQHAHFQDALKNDLQVHFQVRHEFFDLLNGISIDLHDIAPSMIPKILDKIKALPGVVKVSPLMTLNQPKMIVHHVGMDAKALAPQLNTSHEITGVLKARNKLGLTGKGIKIGIIDTGVDYTHPALGGCYGPGCKVQYGYDFVDGPFDNNTPGGFDCVGHGTHVAGIIAANSTKDDFYGVAPQGSAKDDVIIAALEKAYDDGMDIVNLSLGGGSAWAESSLAQVAGVLANLGTVVVAASGNDGEQGFSEISSPAISKEAISVSSFEGSGYLSYYFSASNSEHSYDITDMPPSSMTNLPLPLTIAQHDPEGCTPYPNSVQDQVVLIKRGSCTFVEKMKRAQEAGAIGCIFYNNVEGKIHPAIKDPAVRIFGHGISLEQGLILLEEYRNADGSLTIVYSNKMKIFENPTAGQISGFSSWGLGPELELKPDIGAPGGYIYSTVPVSSGSYSTMSGTSMATPFVAGAVALLLESNPNINRLSVLGQLQSYADPGMYKDTNVPDTVVRQGAGLVNVYAAIQGKAKVVPSHIAWNDTSHRPESVTVTLTNNYDTDEVFEIDHLPAMSVLGYTTEGVPTPAVKFNANFADIATNASSVRLGAGQHVEIDVSFVAPPDLPPELHWLFSGYIQIKPTLDTSRPSLRIPYAGMHGSYGSLDVLDMGEGFPMILGASKDGSPAAPLRNLEGQGGKNGSENPTVFTMRGRDYATLLLKISNPIRGLRVFVYDHDLDAIVGEAPIDGSVMGRTDVSRTKYFALPWIGRAVNSAGRLIYLPDGIYSLIVFAPKPFSDPLSALDSDHEVWTSPPMAIRRY